MHFAKRWPLPLVVCPVLFWGWVAAAQPDAPAPSGEPSPPSEPLAQPVQEAPARMLYMLDEEGKPVPTLLGWSLPDFWELFERAEGRQQPDPAPRYVLKSLSARGKVEAGLAELTIRLTVWTRDADWTRVPIGIHQAIALPGQVAYQGDGECFLHLDQEGRGYAVWLRGVAQRQHELTLSKVRVPLAVVGQERRLGLSAPGSTSSDLTLTVPWAEAVAEVSEGATLEVLSPEGSPAREFKAQWAGGDFELTLRKDGARPFGTRPVLEAKCIFVAKIQRRAVITEAYLRVRGDGRPFDRFRLLLPRGAELIRANGSGYSVTSVAQPEAEGEQGLFEVQRDKREIEPMEVRLSTKQPLEPGSAGGLSQLGGFEVIDAIQQRGHVAVGPDGNWEVRCVPGGGVHQIEALPDEVQEELGSEIPSGGFAYLFEYFSQPFSLSAGVVEITRHVRVEPEYRIYVEEDRVELEATLRYTVRGEKETALVVDLPGWSLDDAGPDNVVSAEKVPAGKSGLLSIPLAHPSTGQMEIAILAHQPVKAGSRLLRLELPRPRADSLSPAVVAVVPADNLELTPDSEAIRGLVRQQVAPQIELRPGQQEPLFYRGESGEAVFAARTEVHSQKVSVDVSGDVVLGDGKADVHQTLAYAIAYEPVETVDLTVPASLAGPDALELLVDGQRLTPVSLPEQEDPLAPLGAIRQRIALPAPKIGRCELEVRFSSDFEPLAPDTTVLCEIPLLMPAEGKLSGNRLYVKAPQGVEVVPRGPDWQPSEAPAGRLPRHGSLALSAEKRISHVALGIHLEDLVTTVVEAAWVQTYLTSNTRWEQAVFRLTTDEEQLELALPEGVDFQEMEVLLGPEKVAERQRVPVRPLTPDSRVLVPLPEEARGHPQCLEVRYGFLDPRPAPGLMSFDLPHLGGEVWVQRTYWELLLPQTEHLIVEPRGFTPEWRWGWTGVIWGRKPLLEQGELEAWSGASRASNLPQATSRYLFSSLAPVKRCELRSANRWLIVSAASSIVLVAGLLLIYVPACRHPAALLIVAILVLGAAALYPGPALMASQAASLGLVLALSAGLLHRLLGPPRSDVARREPSSSVLDRVSTQAQYPPPAGDQQASTDTHPAPVSFPASESNA